MCCMFKQELFDKQKCIQSIYKIRSKKVLQNMRETYITSRDEIKECNLTLCAITVCKIRSRERELSDGQTVLFR